MKLLICTQAVDLNHSNLALFHAWLKEFARECEEISVICLFEGEHDLPSNVRIYSLGKERGAVSRAHYAWRFMRLLARVPQYDAVFVHMNPEYIVLGGWLWRMRGKVVALWYTHKSVTLKLRIATMFANKIFTASAESFRIRSPKVRVLGHGIDTARFSWDGVRRSQLNICTVGRIAQSKQLIAMLAALDTLNARQINFDFSIAGAPAVPQDEVYEQKLIEEIRKRPYALMVHLVGTLPYKDLPAWLNTQSVFLNLSLTGSIDRAVLEAALCGVVPVSSNEAFKTMLSPYGLFVENKPASVADGIVRAMQTDPAPLVEYVKANHSLETLIPRIVEELSHA